jgi:integrase
MTADCLLTDAAAHHVTINPVSAAYDRQVKARCEAFAQWVGRELTVSAIPACPALLSSYLLHLERSGLAPITVRGYRVCILAACHTVLNAATLGPLVRRVKRSSPPPRCWTQDEIRQLLRVATTMPGKRIDGVAWPVWWPALIHTAYSTGQRLGDLLAMKPADIMHDGTWTVTQNKTGKAVTLQLSADALTYGRRIATESAWLPWPYSIETLRKRFKGLVRLAGIRPGTIKWIRRTAGSYYEASHPGAGHRLLGNTRQVFDEAYHDRSITEAQALQAPSLVGS